MELEKKLEEAFEGQKKLFEAYKGEVSNEIKELKDGMGKLSPETQEKIEKMEVDFAEYEKTINELQTKIKEKNEAYEKKMKEMEAKFNRPRGETEKKFNREDWFCKGLFDMAKEEGMEEKVEATWQAIRNPLGLTPEQKGLTLQDPETGGYLAAPELINDIIKEVRETTPVMQIAQVRTTSSNTMVFPKKTGTITARRRGETETKVETSGLKYGGEQITLPELYMYLDVTEMDLEDTMFNLEAEIREEFSDAASAKIGDEFINGSGPVQLEGILVNPDVAEINSGDANNLTTNGMIEFVEAGLKQQHKVRASLGFNLSTLSKIRLLEDGAGGFAWVPGFGTTPNTILGKPYWISEDLPDVGADAFPIVYGDWKKGYRVGMRVRLVIKRITDSALDETGEVRISGRMRVGGKVVLAPAMKKMKIAA